MTNEQEKAKELAELLNAFAEGKQLEYYIECESVWCDYSKPQLPWILDHIKMDGQIRIKPETKRIALNQQDLINRELSNQTMWIRLIEGGTYQRIIAFGKEHLTVNGGTLYYGVLVDNYEFLDGTPCYKEVEDE